MSRKNTTFLFVAFLIIISIACEISFDTSGGNKSEAPSEAEQTLQAIYAADTAQAAAEAALMVAPTADVTLSQAPEATDEPTSEPLLMPSEPRDPERTLEDYNSSYRGYEHRGTGGDVFLNGLYERPFTSIEMIYQPDLDIITVDFIGDNDFYYTTIRLFGLNPDTNDLSGTYGVEFDCTQTGRGDLLVMAEKPQQEWSSENVMIYTDINSDIGGPKPMIADEGYQGDGYDSVVEMAGDKAAFARIDPDDKEAVQIAVSRALLDNPDEFLWGAWADNGLKDPSRFDYNDSMGPGAAGSIFKDNKDYPVNSLYSVDNTCRLPHGLAQTGAVPGMCLIGIQAPEPGSKDGRCYCLRWSVTQFPPVCLAWSPECN